MKFEGKAAIVTGGGTGLGRAVVLALAREGCAVAVNYPGADRDEAEATAAEAEALGVRAIAVCADVSRDDQVVSMVAETSAALGRLDVLINNAGTTIMVPFQDLDALDEADWDRVLGVNVKGAFFCSRAVAPVMRKTDGGRIVSTASVSGLFPVGSSIPYSVSKSALMGLTRCLAVALAPDILVNAIAPGRLPTRWGTAFGDDSNQEYIDQALTHHLVEVDEAADALLSLARNDSITGQVLVIDGGAFLQ